MAWHFADVLHSALQTFVGQALQILDQSLESRDKDSQSTSMSLLKELTKDNVTVCHMVRVSGGERLLGRCIENHHEDEALVQTAASIIYDILACQTSARKRS